VVALSLVQGLEYPAAKKEAGSWKFDASSQLASEKTLKFKLMLKPNNADQLEKRINEIGSPKSPSFHKYMNHKEINELVGVHQTDLEKVLSWAKSVNFKVTEIPMIRDWVAVEASVSAIEKGLKTKLGIWKNGETGQTKVGAVESYTIPEHLANVVQYVPGLTSFSFGTWKPIVHYAKDVKEPNGVPKSVTPDTIYELYQSPSASAKKSMLGSQAVIEYGTLANFNTADLETFFEDFNTVQKGEQCGVAYGTNNGDIKGSVEANLDVQYIMAVGQFVNTTTYKIAEPGVGIEDQFIDYTTIVLNQIDPPLVHSISYGEYGGEYDNVTDQRLDYELQKMGAIGVTVLLASGDNGVGCNKEGTSQEFDFPSSGYLTMVGATYLDSASGKEVGATLSSGGFSKDYYRPSWQDEAVAAYFASPTYKAHTPSESFYPDGRAYPDIAAFGQNVQVVAAGKSEGVSGTSCSAPIFAGVIAQINHELLSRGLAPMGWINPWIYANPQMFTDVTEGSNPYEKCDGFYAAAGWDPVTGYGTPIYPKMLEAALAAAQKK